MTEQLPPAPLPLYRKIAVDLRRQIESGELEPGQQLKTELALREQYGASRNTIRDAMRMLTDLGLVEIRPGQGTFVTRRMTPHTTVISLEDEPDEIELEVLASKTQSQCRQRQVTEPRVEIQRARGELAAQLRVAEGNAVISRHLDLSIDGIPWCRQATYYPMEFVNHGALQLIETANLEQGAVAYLEKTIGVRQTGWSDLIIARAPEGNESDFFGLSDSSRVPVFEIRRTGYDRDGNPMRLSITVFPADRNKIMYNKGQSSEWRP
jgi:GntR family transcriptional regulator